MAANQVSDLFRRCISSAKPYDLWGMAFYRTTFVEIAVLGHNHISVLTGKLPNGQVIGLEQIKVPKMSSFGILMGE